MSRQTPKRNGTMGKVELTILAFAAIIGLWGGGIVLNMLSEIAAKFPA